MKVLSKLNIFIIVLISIIVLLLIAYSVYQTETKEIVKQKHEFLHAVTNLKLEQIINWKKSRTSDASFFPTIGKFIKYTDNLKNNDNATEAVEYFSKTLMQFVENRYDENIIIADINGKILFSVDSTLTKLYEARIEEVKNAVLKDSVIFGDFYFDTKKNKPIINIISVIKNNNHNPIGAFVQQVDPEKSLISIIKKWPIESKTAETLLFRKENDSIIFLNELRHLKNTALNLKISLSRNDIVAVKGALGQRGIIEGKDYRGVDVLAELKPVPGTDWYMVSKIDKDELLSEINYRTRVLLIIVLLAVLFISAIALFIYKQQQSSVYKNLYLKEKELLETQEEYRTALYSIGDGVITTDTKGNIKQMNAVAEKLTGWTEVEAKGLLLNKIFNIVNEETGTKVANPVELVLEKGTIISLANHTLLIKKDGQKIPIADSGSPIKDEKNKIIGVVLVFRDQTEERKKEKKIIETTEKYLKIFNTSADSISLTLMSSGKVVEINEGFERIFGYSNEEIIGKSTVDLGLWENPQEREEMVKILKTNGYVRNFEAVGRHKNGDILNTLISGEIIELAGVDYLLLTIREITEIKEMQFALKTSEEKFKKAFTTSPDSININRLSDGMFVSVNPGFLKLTGYTEHDVIGKTSLEINIWADFADRDKLIAGLKGSGVVENLDARFKLKNGEIKDGLMSAVIIELNGEPHIISITRDITDRKNAENYLIAKLALEEQINKIVRTAPGGLCSFKLSAVGKVSMPYVSNAWCDLYNLTQKDVIDDASIIFSKMHPDDLEYVKETIQKSAEQMIDWKAEFRIVNNKNGVIWVRGHSTPTLEDDGSILWHGFISDITERKQAEQELLKSEERLRLSLKAAHQGLYDLNIQTGEAIVNDEYALMLGYDPKTFIETNSFWIDRLHPDDKDAATNAFKEYINGTTSEYKIEFRQRTSNNDWKWILSLGKTVEYDSSGKPLRMLGTHTDISELKQYEEQLKSSEEKFSKAFFISPVSININRLSDGVYVLVNRSFCRISGFTEEEVIGKSALETNVWVNIEDRERYLELLKKNGAIENFETKFRVKSGEIRDDLISSTLIDINGERHILSIITDITENKQLFNDLNEAKVKAEEMNRLKAFFFANMSHELRTPFVGIMGFSEILAGSLQNDEEREMAEQILKSSKRLTDTLNKILNVTRLEFDKIDLIHSEFDVCQTLKNIESLYSSTAKIKNTVIITETENHKLIFKSDQRLLEEILNNLVSNAVKFTENGIIKLTASVVSSDDHKNLIIKVEDTGIGIPKDKQHIVWYEFRQASEGLNRSFEGSGLGLTISKKYVEMLGGEISLESELNVGSVFTIKLPMNNVILEKIEKSKPIIAATTKTVSTKSTGKKHKILYVEDDAIALNYISIVLRKKYDVTTAFSAEIALELTNTTQFELLMLDINLGKGMDGIELMQKIKQTDYYKNIPTVAVTAYAAQADKEEFLSKGFTHYISKPFTSSELKSLLQNIFSGDTKEE